MGDFAGIRAFQRISAALTTSGRLEQGHFATLAAAGVRHVIDLVPPGHPDGLAGEAEIAAAAGLAYANIPVPFDAPDEAHYTAFCAAMAAAAGDRVHVHCIANWRVSAFLYRWHRDTCGMDESAARSLMEQQWSPLTSDHPAAPAWARFCGLREA